MKTSVLKATWFHKSIHLNETDLIEIDPRCPFCGSVDRRAVHNLQQNPQIDLLTCESCNASSASRIPTDETLHKYYTQYYQSTLEKKEPHNVTVDVPLRFSNLLYKAYRKYSHTTSMRILDFGGGDGTIAIELAKLYQNEGLKDTSVNVVDLSFAHGNKKINGIDVVYRPDLPSPSQAKFDVIIASSIIEHLSKPKQTILSLLELVSNGGIFYQKTPFLVPFIRMFKRFGLDFDFTYPGHIHDLGPHFWNNILRMLKLEQDYEIILSKPSTVEAAFAKHFLVAFSAHVFKIPWIFFGNRYQLVGGWELIIRNTKK